MIIIFRHDFRRVDMNPIGSLVQSIFSLNIVIYFANANTVSGCYNGCFIIFVLILS